jgi:hypothetical protein
MTGVKLRLGRGETTHLNIGKGIDKNAVCHQFYVNCEANTLPTEAIDGIGAFRLGGRKIFSVKFADDLMKSAKDKLCYRAF